jgi:methylated-DNA-[protein]-cysteine S-methyltransferase
MNMLAYDTYESPQGPMLITATPKGLAGVYFKGQKHFPKKREWQRDGRHPVLRQARRELDEYFAGKRRCFDVALDPQGTDFQRSVWKAIAKVGFGETLTYGELARRAGHPGSARAAGAATGRNPIGIIVPCHRIMGSDGSLTGYAGGLKRKRALLALEGANGAPGAIAFTAGRSHAQTHSRQAGSPFNDRRSDGRLRRHRLEPGHDADQ